MSGSTYSIVDHTLDRHKDSETAGHGSARVCGKSTNTAIVVGSSFRKFKGRWSPTEAVRVSTRNVCSVLLPCAFDTSCASENMQEQWKHRFSLLVVYCRHSMLYTTWHALRLVQRVRYITTLHHHSPHSSSLPSLFAVLPNPLAPSPGPFLIAAVPTLLGVAVFPLPAAAGSAPKLSQKSCLSLLGPLGAAPNESQKSRFSGSTAAPLGPPDLECVTSSPSTNLLNVSVAFFVANCAV